METTMCHRCHTESFLKCGLANAINGKEDNKVEVLDLLTYSVPGKDFVPRKEPYSEEEQWALYQKEFTAFQEDRKRRRESNLTQRKAKRAKLSFI